MAAANLRAGGLEDEAVAHERSAAALRKGAAPESAGGRLDACAGFVARAEKRVEGAKAAVQTAEAALAEARAAQERLEDVLAERRRRLGDLRAELAAAPAAQTAPPDTSLLGDVQALLTLMEGGACQFGAGSEPVLAAMQRLHAAIGVAAPAPVPELGASLESPVPLEPSTLLAPLSPQAAAAANAEDPDEDDAMRELDSAESGDDAALVAAARRLRQTRSARFGLVKALKTGKDRDRRR